MAPDGAHVRVCRAHRTHTGNVQLRIGPLRQQPEAVRLFVVELVALVGRVRDEVDDLDAYDECVREGEARQRQAERADCEDEFITLLECLEATYVCGGSVQPTDCEAQSDALAACSIR